MESRRVIMRGGERGEASAKALEHGCLVKNLEALAVKSKSGEQRLV